MTDQKIGLTLDASLDPSGVLSAIKTIQNGFNGLKIDPKLMSGLSKEFEKVNTLITKYQSQLTKGVNTKTDAKNLAKTGSEIQNSLNNIVKGIQEVNSTSIVLKVEDAAKLKTLEDNLKNIKKQIQDTFQQKIDTSGLSEALTKFAGGTGRAKSVQNLVNRAEVALERQELEKFGNLLDEIKGKLSGYKGSTLVSIGKALGLEGLSENNVTGSIEKITNKINELKTKATEAGESIKGLKEKEEAAAKAVNNFKPDAIAAGTKEIDGLATKAQQVPPAFNQIRQAAENAASGILDAKTQVDQLKQSTQYFFSLRNMINLLKRGVREAVDVVKELDAAMTETAVVTDFSVGDMWAKLPEYTANANALGASVKDMYEATTLYYQQGLNTEQAMGIAAETMKMARIGGLEAADATDKMTAALRGFNMELNEVSAQRVNDVYSNLAAKTASDTEELGTAMQRTASIAASAGMSFEGTAAFLAQAIETTREPAENLGTAMKTIVARFTELKKNPLEIAEVDGEEVSYNKVDTALQSIGVSLKDTNGQFRNLDQVFMDIAQRWDSLTQTQQRYIATTAAGSRQQSRFIAMMSNYERTAQLMDYANNSAGASNEQFGKTMESLEAKLNKLRNAWQQFEMGIANNSLIKGAVDGLTSFLNLTNTIIDKLSLGSGVIKSFLSVFAAFTGLKATGRIANRLIGGLGGLVDPTSSFKQGFRGGAIKQGQTGAAQAKAISDPIVLAVNRIYGAITGKQVASQTIQNTTADFKSFKEANAEIRSFLGGVKTNEKFSITDAYGKISNLDERQQKAVLQQLPGLQLSLQKGIEFDTTGISTESKQLIQSFVSETNKGLKEKAIDSQGILQLFGTPDNFKRAMEARGPEYAKAASEVLFNQKAYDEAYKQTYQNLLSSDDMSYLSEEQLHQAAHKEAQAVAEAKALEEYNKRVKGTASAGMQAANSIASVGQSAVMAGQGVAQLGMQLSNAGFKQAGQAVTNLGYQISSLGQIATSVGSIVGKISGAGGIGALAAANPVITALIAGVALLGGAFAVATVHLKNIKKAGEEVTNTFKETNKSVEDNIAKLKSYQSEFATLSKGVDSNGNNVNLDDSQYQRYLEIVDDIAAINPDIVEGYNEQGHAIINNNTALAETLKLQEQIKDQTYKTYTSEESLQKLINARNVNKGYYEAVANKTKAKGTFVGGTEGQVAVGYTSPLSGDVVSIAEQLGLISNFDEQSLEKYGIESLDALVNGEEQAVKNFIKHRQQIENDLNNSGINITKGITKGFEKLGKDSDAFDEAIQPIYDNLATQFANMPIYESIPQEFKQFAMSGLKDIASQDWGADKMAKEAKILATRIANLSDDSSDYAEVIEEVAQAQDNFAATLDETQYEADVQPAIDELERLKQAALDEGTVYGSALAEYLENQIQQIVSFTEEGSISITDALNTATDDIAEAESALENFSNSTKSDYWTAAEGMKSIYDKATETFKDSFGSEWEKHFEGHGDKTAWEAGRALFGEDALEGISVDKLRQKFKEWEPALREGEEGWYNFWQKVTGDSQLMESLNAIDGVHWDEDDFYIPDDKWAEVAKTIGISEDMLTAMLNKGRQFANISFANWEDVRKAFATSDTTIKGTSAAKGEEQNLYVKKDTWEQTLADSGYTPEQYYSKENERGRKEQNIQLLDITNSAKTLKKQFEDMGVKTLPNLITTLAKTGDFTKDEIKEYAEKLDLLNDQDFDQLYTDSIEKLENPELAKQTDKLNTIEGYTSEIRSYLNRKEVAEGRLTNPLAEAGMSQLIGADPSERTKYELFAAGVNENGSPISDQERTAVQTELRGMINDWKNYLIDVDKGIDEAYRHGNKEAGDALTAEKEGILANIALAEKFIDRSEEAAKRQEALAKAEDQAQKKKDREIQDESNADKRNVKPTPSNDAPVAPKTAPTSATPTAPAPSKTESKKVEYTEEHIVDGKVTPEFKQVSEKMDRLAKQNGETTSITVTADGQEVKQVGDYVDSLEDKEVNVVTKGVTTGAEKVKSTVENIADKTVNVGTKGDTSGADTVKSAIASVVGKTVTIGTKLGSTAALKTIDDKIAALARKGNNIKINTTAYKGQNNKIPYRSLPSFGSAARGRYGTVGPKNKGGLTLTGEKGFEIAWLPSENRSMILGAGGPQMLNLPADAVVYSHEQSKDILKRKGIPAGSHSADTKGSYDSSKSKYDSSSQSSSGSNTNPKPKPKPKPDEDKQKEKVSKKVFSWWEKISRQVKAAEKNADNIGNKLTKIFNDIRASIEDVNKANKDFIKSQNQTIKLNQEIATNSQNHLNALADGGSKSNRKAVSKARKAVKNAKGKKAKAKAKKNLKNLTSGDQWANVKWGSGKKAKSQKVDMSQFIDYDEKTGAYVVNKEKINAKTKDSKAKRKAIQDKAYELIDKYTGRLDDANESIEKAQDAMANYRKEIDDTFFGWENELTKVYRITSEIEKTEALIGKSRSKYDLNQTKLEYLDLSYGTDGARDLNNILKAMKATNEEMIQGYGDEINQKTALVASLKEEISKYDELDNAHMVTYETIDGTIAQATELSRYAALKIIANNGSGTGWDELSENDKNIYTRGRAFEAGYITKDNQGNWSINETAIANAIAAGQMTADFGERLKTLFDNLKQNTIDTINAESEIYNLQQEQLKTEHEYEDQVKQIAEQLYGWKNTLTKILELTNRIEASEKRTSLLKSSQDYYAAKQKVGEQVSPANILNAYVGQMLSTINQLQDRTKLLEKQRSNLQKYIAGQDIATELTNLRAKQQTDVEKARIAQLEEEARIRKLAQRYVYTKTNADGTIAVEFNTDLFEKEKGAKYDNVTAPKIEEYAQELANKNNEIAETMAATASDIIELYTALADLRQEYADRAKELREAYGAQQQKIIDNLKNLYSAIDNSFKELINQVKQSIQQRRQIEDNAKTEQDISKKQQRLAALRANTAGGNQVAIAQLEKEIADAQQSYGRTLEDQLLEKISQQGDLAAKQREQQIQLMQVQRDLAAKTGADAAQINQWLHNPEEYKTNISAVLQSAENWNALTTAEQEVFKNSLDTKLADLNTLPDKIDTTITTLNTLGSTISTTESNIKSTVQTAIDNIPSETLAAFTTDITNTNGKIDIANSGITAVAEKLDADLAKKIEEDQAKAQAEAERLKLTEELDKKKAERAELVKQQSALRIDQAERNYNIAYENRQNYKEQEQRAIQAENQARLKVNSLDNQYKARQMAFERTTSITDRAYIYSEMNTLKEQIAAANRDLTAAQERRNAVQTEAKESEEIYKTALRELNEARDAKHALDQRINAITNDITTLQNQLSTLQFASGGLSTSTGPAWLHGTPSKPELVLNANDTRNFLALRDVLGRVLGTSNSINESNGNARFEININVDHLSSDYDVDKVVERVKKKIVQDSSYRNVTQVRNFR